VVNTPSSQLPGMRDSVSLSQLLHVDFSASSSVEMSEFRRRDTHADAQLP